MILALNIETKGLISGAKRGSLNEKMGKKKKEGKKKKSSRCCNNEKGTPLLPRFGSFLYFEFGKKVIGCRVNALLRVKTEGWEPLPYGLQLGSFILLASILLEDKVGDFFSIIKVGDDKSLFSSSLNIYLFNFKFYI